MSNIILLGMLFAVVGVCWYLVTIYNGLIALKNDIDKAWANIDVMLKQRHDELSKLLDVCKGYMDYERDTLPQDHPGPQHVSAGRDGRPEGAGRPEHDSAPCAGSSRLPRIIPT